MEVLKEFPTRDNSSIENERVIDANELSRCPSATQPDFTIIWHNLTHRVDSRPWYVKAKARIFKSSLDSDIEDNISQGKGERKILNQLCGEVKSRELTGILGPSGAGKSTLLHCLFQNRTVGTSGHILVDIRSKKRLKVCFIPQKDYLNEWLTVREDLIFVSKLKSARLSGILKDNSCSTLHTDGETVEGQSYVRQDGKQFNTSLIDHEANALRVSELLGLNSCLDVPIRNISGGQKKRLSIARELMSKPNILILDEPTTGLDSLTCYKTMLVLRDLAQQSPHPLAVVVTIHQPPRAVFNLFDKTYFISNKGQVVYEGSPRAIAETLEKAANIKLPSPNNNQASTLIEISSNPMQRDVAERLSAYHRTKFSQKYDKSYLKKLMQSKNPNWRFCTMNESCNSSSLAEQSKATEQTRSSDSSVDDITSAGDSTASFNDEYFISYPLRDCISSHSNSIMQSFKHIFILTHRSWLSHIRNPTLTRSRLVFHTALPLIMLMIFGTHSGTPNNCPAIRTELTIDDMRKSVSDDIIKRNVEETRLSFENISFYFILMYGFAINIISSTASHYPLTIHMFKKETINGLYSAGPYIIGQTIAELPLEIFFPSFSVLLAYSLSGQISSYLEWRMFAVTLMVLLVSYTVHSLGLLFGSIFVNNINVSVLLGQVALFPPIMFSGFLIRNTRMPDWMLNLSMFSFFKHALNGIVAARYGFNVCECDEDMIPEDGQPVGFSGLPPNVKHVLDYMFPKNETDDVNMSELFDRISHRFIKAQTFALNITSCDDVKPYSMTAFGVYDFHLYRGILALLIMITILKFTTFSIVKLSPYRIN